MIDDPIETPRSFACEAGTVAALIVALAVLALFALSVLDLFWPIAE